MFSVLLFSILMVFFFFNDSSMDCMARMTRWLEFYTHSRDVCINKAKKCFDNVWVGRNHSQQLKYFEQTELKAIAAYFTANGAQRVNHSDGNLIEISTKIVCIKDVHMDIQAVISNIVPSSVSIWDWFSLKSEVLKDWPVPICRLSTLPKHWALCRENCNAMVIQGAKFFCPKKLSFDLSSQLL